MRKFFLATLTVAITVMTGCLNEPEPPPPSALKPAQEKIERQGNIGKITRLQSYDLSVVVTVGNHSYIPLEIDSPAPDHIRSILEILDFFEKQHPELEITSWNLLNQQGSKTARPYTYGIWINHKLKK